jgi:uncharacterized damage-inducible protein DinB
MNKQALLGQREYFKLVHGITLKMIATFSDEELDFRPQHGMRSPRELIYHIYAMERGFAEFVPGGRLTQESEDVALPEKEVAKTKLAALQTTAALQAFVNESHQMADEAIAQMSDEDLAKIVEAPYGSFPAWQFFTFAYDEHWHHRGQLYTYLRLLGKEPPMLYSYE